MAIRLGDMEAVIDLNRLREVVSVLPSAPVDVGNVVFVLREDGKADLYCESADDAKAYILHVMAKWHAATRPATPREVQDSAMAMIKRHGESLAKLSE